ncbi:hypothetical protein DEU56DRAFT_833965 [Suillus clintonianus]|uniref:uncharacterized protein n=1 Tax=Suillus clintonianus TaxID=1904413 RepID=UPI001B867E83|nr:uncharacterized protein DEU56DRAFT_833965 [Suillus clintonianus]KAG2121590.1 hypothetical protein DEU56DRAFT_833965 [Suillus clintonianus]
MRAWTRALALTAELCILSLYLHAAFLLYRIEVGNSLRHPVCATPTWMRRPTYNQGRTEVNCFAHVPPSHIPSTRVQLSGCSNRSRAANTPFSLWFSLNGHPSGRCAVCTST